MIIKVLKAIVKNIEMFISIWFVLLILNQVFLFSGCIKSYCLIAGLPHTGFIAAFLVYIFNVDEKNSIYSNDDKVIEANNYIQQDDSDIKDIQKKAQVEEMYYNLKPLFQNKKALKRFRFIDEYKRSISPKEYRRFCRKVAQLRICKNMSILEAQEQLIKESGFKIKKKGGKKKKDKNQE